MPGNPVVNRSQPFHGQGRWAVSRTRPSVPFLMVTFGVLSLLAAALWCVGGAGIYGSPLGGMQNDERAGVLMFVALGPLTACIAALVSLPWPRGGSIALIVGGIASGVFVLGFLLRDAGFWPLVVMSMPMMALGWWRLREIARGPHAHQASIGWTLVDMVVFGVMMWGTHALITVFYRYDAFHMANAPLVARWLLNAQWRQTFLVSSLLVAALVLGATIFRARLFNIRWSILAGAWWGVLMGLAQTFE